MIHKFINNKVFIFNQWSKMAFAVFASIGKQINIGNLTFDFHELIFSTVYNTYQNTFENTIAKFLSIEEFAIFTIRLELYKNNTTNKLH